MKLGSNKLFFLILLKIPNALLESTSHIERALN